MGRGCADVLTCLENQYLVVVALKKETRSIKQTKAIALLLRASAMESGLPMLAIATDLSRFYKLYWHEQNDAGLSTIDFLRYQYGHRLEFFSVVRAFIAITFVASPVLPSGELSSWLMKDGSFDTEYDETINNHPLLTHRIPIPSSTPSKTRNARNPACADDVFVR